MPHTGSVVWIGANPHPGERNPRGASSHLYADSNRHGNAPADRNAAPDRHGTAAAYRRTDRATTAHAPPTPVPPTAAPTPSPTPTVVLPWVVAVNPSCEGGGGNESSVTGKIKANDKPAVGQFVQASAGPGGEPISEVPAQSDAKGNYKVTFVCGGKACNGDFWIWMVDANRTQISPFVKFSFNDGCRKGHVDFQKR